VQLSVDNYYHGLMYDIG